MMRPRHLPFRLPSVRERISETASRNNDNGDTSTGERVDAHTWTGSGPEYLAYLGRFKPTTNPLASDKTAEYTGQCGSPGFGNLTLDMISLHLRDASDDGCASQDSTSCSHYSSRRSSSEGSADRAAFTVLPPDSPSRATKNSLDIRGLEKYSHGNDRLSNLRSPSGSSGGDSVVGAAEDAAAAAQGWASLRTSWRRRQVNTGAQTTGLTAQVDGTGDEGICGALEDRSETPGSRWKPLGSTGELMPGTTPSLGHRNGNPS